MSCGPRDGAALSLSLGEGDLPAREQHEELRTKPIRPGPVGSELLDCALLREGPTREASNDLCDLRGDDSLVTLVCDFRGDGSLVTLVVITADSEVVVTGGGDRALCGFSGEASLLTLALTTDWSEVAFVDSIDGAFTTGPTVALGGPEGEMPKVLADAAPEGRRPNPAAGHAVTEEVGEFRCAAGGSV